jgi:glycosyltransferase involved in cell wall biosynthesis
MRVLIELTYYRPHTSGLTIYAERLAHALTKRGHQVTVLTSCYDKNLLRNEILDGVNIIRVPVLFRVSKGVVMPTFGSIANDLVRNHDAISLHLPQLDAAGLAFRGRIWKKPTIVTYHCDLRLPAGALSWAANRSVNVMNNLTAYFTHRVVAYTQDYADNSSFLKRNQNKLKIIDPPIELPQIPEEKIKSFRRRYKLSDKKPIIGIAARFASEKGIEVLLDALKTIIDQYPDTQVWYAGQYQHILGEERYYQRLIPIIENYQKNDHWKFLGNLGAEEMAAFYPNLDVLVIPSLNSTESFGLVQIEAMMNGIPVVASNLPGVRQPVLQHGLGRIFPIGNAQALAQNLLELLSNPMKGRIDRSALIDRYSPDSVARDYEQLFSEIKSELQ